MATPANNHIGGMWKPDALLNVLSGEKNTALKILEIAQAQKAEIKFFDADLDGSRDDAAIVDKNGVIYYGNHDDLQSRVSAQDMLLLQEQRRHENSLRFKNDPFSTSSSSND